MNEKVRPALEAVVVAGALALVKLAIGILTQSVSVLASCVDSFSDVLMSAMNAVALRIASRPADPDHGFGHEKAESIAAVVQCTVIGVSMVGVAGLAVMRAVEDRPPAHLEEGAAVMLGTSLVSLLLWLRLSRAARRMSSPALAADGLHYATDIFTNLGVVAALLAVRWTGAAWVDPLVSLVLAVFLIRALASPFRVALDVLMDRELPDDERALIVRLIEAHHPHVVGWHRLRTRRSGKGRFVDFHVVIRHDVTFQEAHDLTESLVDRIRAELPGTSVIAHSDPDTAPLEED